MESKFTQKELARLLNQTGQRQVLKDDRVRGLQAEQRPGGAITFSVLKRQRGGSLVRVTIGKFPAVSVEQARRRAADIVAKLASGVDPRVEAATRQRSRMTLGTLFEDYLAAPTRTRSKRAKSDGTVHDYRLLWNRHLEPWGNRRLDTITRAEVERLHNRIGEDSGHFTANRTVVLLKAIYNHAIDLGHDVANPVVRLRLFEEKSRDRFLQRSELPAFLAALEAEPSEKLRDFFLVCLLTAQRRGNVQTMRWRDINFAREVWTLPKTKTGKHEVPLIADALQILRRRYEDRPEGQEFVFPGRHGKESLRDPMRAWRSICDRAGIPDLRIHDLRRTAASWQAIGGVSLPTIGRMLGHSSPSTTMVYSRLDDSPVRQAMETAAAAMLAAGRPK